MTLKSETRISKTGIVVLGIIVLAALFVAAITHVPQSLPPEVHAILTAPNQSSRAVAYQALITRVGVDTAQELLYHSGLPFDGETHLLNHESGTAAYEQYGLSGITHCRDYFLESCYHAFFISAVVDHGLGVIPQIMEYCYQGGLARTGQCAHGIGHGLLAWLGYAHLPDAATACDSLAAQDSRFPSFNCIDGVFMENVWAVHDNGIPSPEQWIKAEDAYFPCDDTRIQESWRGACYGNQAALLYENHHGDIAAVAQACSKAPEDYRASCFDGLARELHPLIGNDPEKARTLCQSVESAVRGEGTPCIISMALVSYGVGDQRLGTTLCSLLSSKEQEQCTLMLQRVALPSP